MWTMDAYAGALRSANRPLARKKTSCAGGRCKITKYMPRPCKLTFDLLTLKVVSESVLWSETVVL